MPRLAHLPAAALLATCWAIAPLQANAQTSSENCVLTNFVIPELNAGFDIGILIDRVISACNSQGNTLLPNGPYRRLIPTTSLGNARNDYVVAEIPGNGGGSVRVCPTDTNGKDSCSTTGRHGSISDQIGINPGVTLSATVTKNSSTNTATYTDTTGADTSGAFANQLVDAGGGIGGLECAILEKQGTPYTADAFCDANPWFKEGSTIVYGFKNISNGVGVTNRTFLLWAMGPSGAGTPTGISNICAAFNPGTTPERHLADDETNNIDEGDYKRNGISSTCAPGDPSNLDPGDYCVGNAWTREERTVNVIGNPLRFFGDPEQPANFTACGAAGSYCDPTEPTPETAGDSGNACNPNTGGSGVPNVSLNGTLEGNSGQWVKIGGQWMYVNYTN